MKRMSGALITISHCRRFTKAVILCYPQAHDGMQGMEEAQIPLGFPRLGSQLIQLLALLADILDPV
jgi:hypothetical protein